MDVASHSRRWEREVTVAPRGRVRTVIAWAIAIALLLLSARRVVDGLPALASLVRPSIAAAPWPELTSAAAGDLLSTLLVLLGALAATGFALHLLRRRTDPAAHWLVLLGTIGVVFIAVGVLHNLLGALVVDSSGFWAERTAFPTAMTTAGGTLIGFAGLAWSLNAEQRARDRRAREQERSQRMLDLERTVRNVDDTIRTCDQLAERGIRLVADHLERIAPSGVGDVGDPSGPEGSTITSPAAWFNELFSRKADEDWGWAADWDPPTDCPRTTRQLVAVIGHRLHDPQEWRAAQQFVDLVRDRARTLSADGRLWEEEYLELRARVSGISSEVPIDLLPFVDDLEFVRDLVRIGSDIGDESGASATFQHLVTLAVVIALLRGSRESAAVGDDPEEGAERHMARPGEPTLHELHRALVDADATPGLFPDRHRSTWCDALRRDVSLLDVAPSDPDPKEQDVLHHVLLVLLAGVRRRRLQLLVERERAVAEKGSTTGSRGAVDLLRFWSTIRERTDEEIPFGTKELRSDFPRIRWPRLSQEQDLRRFIELDRQTDAGGPPDRRGAGPRAARVTKAVDRRAFDWSDGATPGRLPEGALAPDGHA